MSESGTNTPDRPIAVTIASRALWTVAAALAVAAVVKVLGIGPAREEMGEALLYTAGRFDRDPDTLEMTPLLAGATAMFAVLAYACSAFFHALTAHSVGKGNRPSFALAVFTWSASVVCCGVQPFTWYRIYAAGEDTDRSILDHAVEDFPQWLTAVELTALALVALSTVAVGLLLRSDAKAFRRPAPEPAAPATSWRFSDKPPRDARERDAHRPRA